MIRAKSTRSRYALTASIFVVVVASVLLVIHLADILGQYRTIEYVVGLTIGQGIARQHVAVPNQQPIVGDKVIVVARLESEDTDWIKDFLPESE